MVELGREAAKQAELPKVPRLKSLASGTRIAVVALSAVVGLAILAIILSVLVFPPRITISPADGQSEVNPAEQYLKISTSRWGATVTTISVMEKRIAPDGTRDNGRLLEGHLQDGKFVAPDDSNPLAVDAEYTVTVRGTVKKIGFSGIRDEQFEETHTFTTITTPMPIIPKEGLRVKYGEELRLEWNVPISSFEYQLEGVPSTSRTGEEGGRVAVVTLAKFEQGKQYPLKITAATSQNGIELKQPIVTTVSTPPALTVTFDPADGASGASIDVHPAIVFSEPVSNPDLAKTVVTIDPQVDGSFKWTEPNRLEFVPVSSWDHLQDVTIRLKGGPQQFRGIGGGYVEGDQQATFTTAPEKSIDVNVTEQRLTLLENGIPVESFLCSTGATGTDTPLGDFTIYAKIPSVDMRGPGYFAPHVPWVMVFKGDYTIHGNYWATAFGRRSSHGCVGLPVEVAKHVYDWTPIGTPVHIHE